jgi:wyosine [tRNA(Phe)-imidazoG37] synthetase (radical SAM superfamily)
MAVGATMMGMEILNPSTVVLRSTLVTSTRMRGRNLQVVRKFTRRIKIQEISQDCPTIVVVECIK